jgi:hypothetical protein
MAEEKKKKNFCVFQGSQPIFSSDDESECNAIASDRRATGLKQGQDIRNVEHAIMVKTL